MTRRLLPLLLMGVVILAGLVGADEPAADKGDAPPLRLKRKKRTDPPAAPEPGKKDKEKAPDRPKDKPEEKAKGIRLTWAKYRRPSPETEPVHAKAAGLYMICTISKHAAEKDGYTDAMMLDYRGYIAESTGSNVFFIKDGVIHTPLPDCFLDGITRQSVIKLARKQGFEVIERHIRPEELATFTECFVTGTAAEVTPVAQIGEYSFTPGALSLGLMDDYAKMVRRELVAA